MNWTQMWREKIVEPLDELQERGRQQWMTLNPRERLIVSALASVMVVLIAVLVVKEAFTFFSKHENQVQSMMDHIGDIQKLAGEISRQRSDLVKYERLRNKRGNDFKLSTFLEGEARRYNVAIEKLSPTKPKTTEKDADEEWIEVKLAKETTLDAALKFLQAAEEPIGVRLVELEIKPQFTDPTKLDVLAIVASRKEI
jgi:type II secretory pathway component PulM